MCLDTCIYSDHLYVHVYVSMYTCWQLLADLFASDCKNNRQVSVE